MHACPYLFLSTLLTLTLVNTVQAETLASSESTTPATQQQMRKLLTGLPLSFIVSHWEG